MKAMRAFAIILLILCAGFAAYYVTSRRAPEPSPVRHEVARPRPAIKPPAPRQVKVYRIAVENNQPKLRPTEVDVAEGEKPAEIALRHLIEQGETADLANPIPRGTRLLGLEVEGGLAVVNLSREFRDNFGGGSEAEGLAVGAILRTLGQFPEIKRVRLLIDGKSIETLGHLDLSGPLDVNWVGSEYNGGSN